MFHFTPEQIAVLDKYQCEVAFVTVSPELQKNEKHGHWEPINSGHEACYVYDKATNNPLDPKPYVIGKGSTGQAALDDAVRQIPQAEKPRTTGQLQSADSENYRLMAESLKKQLNEANAKLASREAGVSKPPLAQAGSKG